MARQATLPTMESRKIAELEDAAIDYAKVRNKRMKLTEQESDLKGKLTELMKRHNKETYAHGGVTITLVHESETVKVKIAKPEDE